jgi:hypothetical protein
MRLIDADALDSVLEEFERRYKKSFFKISANAIKLTRTIVFVMRTADAVSRGVHERTSWERDVAIEQLESYGVSLGEKADVAKVKHGEWVVCGDGEYVPFICSACGKTTSWYHKQTANYCPNCGADMRERKDNEN